MSIQITYFEDPRRTLGTFAFEIYIYVFINTTNYYLKLYTRALNVKNNNNNNKNKKIIIINLLLFQTNHNKVFHFELRIQSLPFSSNF